MIEIAGLIVSGISLLSDLYGRYKDLSSWSETDLKVDGDYLDLALAKRHLTGAAADYAWVREERVPTVELSGTHQVVVAYNAEKKIKYRLCRGRIDDRIILMKKVA